jgi:tRNA pseudouridine(38-40) synthase
MKTSLTLKEESEPELDKRLRLFFDREDTYNLASSLIRRFMMYQRENSNDQRHYPLLTKLDETDQTSNLYDGLFTSLYCGYSEIDCDQMDKKIENEMKGQNFKIHISYDGSMFCGWQIQPNNKLPSVQETIIDIIDPLLNCEKRNKPIDIRVCGRTDAGVNALGQICRARTRRSDVTTSKIKDALNAQFLSRDKVPSLWCTKVESVSEKFHPTFDANCRAYAYILDANALESMVSETLGRYTSIFSISRAIDCLLHQLENVDLDYFALSFGKVKTETTQCILYRANSCVVKDETGNIGICIELVGNRFLRRMVRILVATVIREAIKTLSDTEENFIDKNRLLSLIRAKDRAGTAKAASSKGLFFLGANFRE